MHVRDRAYILCDYDFRKYFWTHLSMIVGRKIPFDQQKCEHTLVGKVIILSAIFLVDNDLLLKSSSLQMWNDKTHTNLLEETKI